MRCVHLSALIAVVIGAVHPQIQASMIRTVAKAGDTAPGAGGSQFNSFISSPPTINDYGQVAFRAAFANQGPEGIWSEGGGYGLQLVAKFDQQAPGTPAGVLFNYFGPSNPGNNATVGTLSMNNAGQIAFRATLKGAANDEGIWLADPLQGVHLVARKGTSAPGLSGINYSSFRPTLGIIALNNSGQFAFTSSLTGTGIGSNNNMALWSYPGTGAPALVARTGDPVPGSTSSEKFNAVAYDMATIDGQGHALFNVSIGDQNGSFKSRSGVFSQGTTSLPNLVARDDDAAPGTAPGVRFDGLYLFDPAGNSRGQMAWASGISGTGVTTANNAGIWVADPAGTVRLAVRKGDPAPGAGSGVTFAGFYSPEINAAGHLAIHAQLAGPGVNSSNDYGIWAEDATGQLKLLVREGTVAPGTPNLAFANAGSFPEFDKIAFNSLGEVAFVGRLAGAGVNGNNDQGIWATDVSGLLHLIAREGTPFETEPGVFRSHIFLDFAGRSGGDDGLPTGLGNTGQVAFYGAFSDAIYVSREVAVPEPSAALMMLASGTILAAFLAVGHAARRSRSVANCSTTIRGRPSRSTSSSTVSGEAFTTSTKRVSSAKSWPAAW